MPETRAFAFIILALILVAAIWRHKRVGLVVALLLVGLGVANVSWGVMHLKDPLVLRRRAFDYERPQQPGLYAIAWGGLFVVVGAVLVLDHTRGQS